MVAWISRHHPTYLVRFLVLRLFFGLIHAAVLLLALWIPVPRSAIAQRAHRNPEIAALVQQAAVVHRRVTMLARRVQRDLGDSRRFQAADRTACLNDVLSDLHSTQRAVEAWTLEVKNVEAPTPRLRGMLAVFRYHLKELRAEAIGCFGVEASSESQVKVRIEGPQPDEDSSVVPNRVVVDVPWYAPQR